MEEGTGDILSLSIIGFDYDGKQENLNCGCRKGLFHCNRQDHLCGLFTAAFLL